MTSERVRLPLTIAVPIPPASLGKGASRHWLEVRREWESAKWEAHVAIRDVLMERGEWYTDGSRDPHTALVCDVTWCYWNKSHEPDPDNAYIRTAAARDVMQDLGIVDNDRNVAIGVVRSQRVRGKVNAKVIITFRLPTQPVGQAT